jgi:asparagine synthase (glutamine-hydrolysing)
MSGIMAVLSLDGRRIPEDVARAQLAAIAHRGDREPRLWLGQGVALGHVNLPTTTEAERERLPACDQSGRYWITWDGRLDNRHDLALALGLDGPTARTMTEADHVVAAYARWGSDCVSHLLGDWVFVIWDNVARRLFCAKDPLGWRQCFYAWTNGLLFIGSEPQQLFTGGLVPQTVNQDFLLRFLALAMQRPGETCYAGVHELGGGRTLTVTGDTQTLHTYWPHPPAGRRPYHRPEEFVDEFIAVFREATRARLRSNRGLGVFLSGGLDSSYVTAVAVREGADLTAISGYAPAMSGMDERAYARMAVDHLGIAHIEVDVSDCWSLSSRWLSDEQFDQPYHPPQGPHAVRLAGAARAAGIGVVLGGEGGDEWLQGGTGSAADALLRGRPMTAWRLARPLCGRGSTAAEFIHACYREIVPFMAQDSIARLRGRDLGLGLAPAIEPQSGWISIHRYGRSLVWQRTRSQATAWTLYRQLAGPIASWRERNGFTPNGIELRTPFNDLRVIELMAATPDWVKRHHGRPKDLLREALYRVLPRAIPDRLDKGDYSALIHAGTGLHERSRVLDAVEAVASVPGVRGEVARREVLRWLDTRHRWWEPSWRLISAGLWLRSLGVPRSDSGTNPLLGHKPAREEVIA